MESVQNNSGKKRTRMIFVIPEELHKNIKARAALRGMTITTYALQALIEKIEREKQYE